MHLCLIIPLDGHRLPVDPGFGVDEGGTAGQLPVFPGFGGRPSHPIARPGRPVDPGFGVGVGGTPVDPGYGIDAGVDPGYGVGAGGHPDQGLPSSPGSPSHPIVLPPNPPVLKPGETLVLVRHNGQWVYAVVPPPAPTQPIVSPPVATPKA